MGFGSFLGSSALSGGLGHLFESADSFHIYESDHDAFKAIDPLGSAFGGVLKSSEKRKMQKQLDFYQKQMDMEYEMQKKAALEMPAQYRQGFEDAGYNALLALGNTGGATSAFSPRAGAGDYPHESQRRQTNLLLNSALETQQVQREKIIQDTKKSKVDMIVDAVKGLASSAATAFAAYAAAKGFTSRGVPIARGAARRAAGTAAGRAASRAASRSAVSSAAASSAAGTAAASLFTRAIAPVGALSGLTYGVSEAKKAVEKKYGKLPDATDRKYQMMNPRFTGQDDDPRRRRYR